MSHGQLRACARLLAVAFAAMVPPAAAQEQELDIGPGLEGWKNYKGARMEGALLRACVELEYDFDLLDTRRMALKGPLDTAEAHFEHIKRLNDERQATLDKTDSEAVDAFNRSVDDEAKAAAEMNALLPEFNAVVAEYNAIVERFNATCSDRAYLKTEWWNAEEQVRKARGG